MSDTSQGDGWWKASDGKWYPPEQAPAAPPSPAPGARPRLDIGLALSFGWNKFVENLSAMIAIVLIYFGVTLVFNLFANFLRVGGGLSSVLVSFVLMIIGVFIALLVEAGLVRASLAVSRGGKPEPSMMFSTERIGQYVVAAILVSLLSFVGLLFCCIGFIVVRVFLTFTFFFVLDRDKKIEPADALKRSYDMVSRNAGDVILLLIVIAVVNLVTCGLAIGVTDLALGYAYRTLDGEAVPA